MRLLINNLILTKVRDDIARFALGLENTGTIERPLGYYTGLISKESIVKHYFEKKRFWRFEDSEFGKTFNVDNNGWLSDVRIRYQRMEDLIQRPFRNSELLRILRTSFRLRSGKFRPRFTLYKVSRLVVIHGKTPDDFTRDLHFETRIRELLTNGLPEKVEPVSDYLTKIDSFVKANPSGVINLIDGENVMSCINQLKLEEGLNVFFTRRIRIPPFEHILRTEGISSRRDSVDHALSVEATRISVLYPTIQLVVVTNDHFGIDLKRQLNFLGLGANCRLDRVHTNNPIY
jgi:hypothetical protein